MQFFKTSDFYIKFVVLPNAVTSDAAGSFGGYRDSEFYCGC